VVPRKELVKQTVKAFEEWYPAGQVVGITGGKPNAKLRRRMIHAQVWIATPPTAAGPKPRGRRGNERRPGLDGILSRQVLVIDEFHHAAAKTYQDISVAARNAYYRLGLTGTHYRADGKDMAMHALLSRAVYSRSVKDMVDAGVLVPARVAMVRLRSWGQPAAGARPYVSGISEHPQRNQMLVQAATGLIAAGKRVLGLTQYVAHAQALAQAIPRAQAVDGRDNTKVRPALEALEAGQLGCVVGTSVVGEGVDVPAADALIYAAGGKSKVKVVQDTFRVLTASRGKDVGIIIDCADDHHDSLTAAAAQRLALYRKQGFTVDVIDHTQLDAWIRSVTNPGL
jgi:superfamily II DNA or RNA helicase